MTKARNISGKRPELKSFLVLALVFLPLFVYAGPADFCKKAALSLDKKEYFEAVSAYTSAIQLDPAGKCGTDNIGKAYAGRGQAYREIQQYDEAIADFSKAIELNPWNPSFTENLNETKKLKAKAGFFRLAVIVIVVASGILLLIALYSFVRSKLSGTTKAAPSSPGKPISVVKNNPVFQRANARLEEAVKKSFKTTEEYRSYLAVKEMMGKGEHRKALNRYLDRNISALPEPEKLNLFEIRLQLGDTEMARNVYEEIKSSPILKEDVELREKLSKLVSAKGLDLQSGLLARQGSDARTKDETTKEAERLVRAGEYSRALDALSEKAVTALGLDDYNLFLESYVRLGDLVKAEYTLKNIKKVIFKEFPVQRDQEKVTFNCDPGRAIGVDLALYDSMAQLCMKLNWADIASGLYRVIEHIMLNTLKIASNREDFYKLAVSFELVKDSKSAIEVYTLMIEAGEYKDVRDRLVKLKFPEKYAAAAAGGSERDDFKSKLDVSGAVLGGRYELKRVLGEGGMAVVYEARDMKTNSTVAVKRMHSSLRMYPEEYARFRREAEIVQKLRHVTIVEVHEVVEEGLDAYLVFDYVEGKPLSDILLEKKRLPLEECRRIFKSVCQAITYAHSTNIIHRDLKPANIMLSVKGDVKVMDFGLAAELRENSSEVSHHTQSGTPAYMAPEQYSGVVKRETDIYAMGLCLYEMLTGEKPFAGPNYAELKKKKDYRPATELAPWLPAGVDALISRALEPDPSMRFESPMDFYKALMEL